MIFPHYDQIEDRYMAKLLGQIEYMLSNRDQRVSYVRIVRYNFAYSAFGPR